MIAYIFNCENETLNRYLQGYVPVSAGLEPETIIPSLASAFDLFVRPLLGEKVTERLQETASSVEGPEPRLSSVEEKWVRLAQRAVVNLAFWFHFTELSVHITDQGFQRQESETFKSLYKYQEDALRQSFKNKGFNALDSFLTLMDLEPSTIDKDLYADMPVVKERMSLLVRSVNEVDRYWFIGGSYLTFLRLIPHIRTAELTDLEPVIGRKLYTRLKSVPEDTDMEALREHCVPVLAVASVIALVETTGSLTDRGLYYASLQSTSSSTMQAEPVQAEERTMMLDRLQLSLKAYKEALSRFVRENIPEYFSGSPSEAFRRDNSHKHTFWA